MALVFPMFALMAFTLFVVCLLGGLRYIAVQRKQVRAGYFKTFEGSRPPELLVRISNNYNNLLQMTMLFYAVCIIAMVLNIPTEHLILCAWGYVISRVVHSVYHIAFNVPIYRLLIFAVSCVLLVIMWIMVLMHVVEHSA